MKIDRSSVKRALSWAGFLALCAGLTGETCTEDRTIEIVVGAEIVAAFEARGIINTFEETASYDIANEAEIRDILDDNGFESLVIANIEAAFVRVTKRDENATDRTVTGSVEVRRTEDPVFVDLISDASEAVNDESLADWKAVALEAAGVNLINQALQDYLADLYNEVADPREPNMTFRITGTCEPQGVETDFDWEVKVRLTLVGERTVEVIDPI